MPRLEAAAPLTPEWVRAHVGRLTASRMPEATARKAVKFKKDGTPYKGSGEYTADREALMKEKCAERMCDAAMDKFVTDAMRWGLEQEGPALEAYEAETGVIVQPCGFYLHDRIEDFGATPDGLIGADGTVQAKCPSTTTYLRWVLEARDNPGWVPDEYRAQMATELAVMRRKWCDFIAFDPRVQRGPRILIRRFEPAPEEIAEIEREAEQFLLELEQMFQIATTGSVEGLLRRSLQET